MLTVLLAAAGCGQKKAEQFTALPFPDITLPAMIQNQQDQLYKIKEAIGKRGLEVPACPHRSRG